MPEKFSSSDFSNEKPGFVVAPFDTCNHEAYFLKAESVYFDNDIDDITIDRLATVQHFLPEEKTTENQQITTTSFDEYTGNVHEAIEAIKAGKFHKVVLSKVRRETLPGSFTPELFFVKLCNNYPHAMVYLLQLPGVGCWTGATPEPLLVADSGTVSTVSLAGTQIATGKALTTYQWSEKELEEQAIVTTFVEKTLRNSGVKELKKTGPENYQAANLIHLKTTFEFSATQINGRFDELLGALHPTPSVGGLPKKEAREFILSHEKHDRSYYTGFLGPVNINKKTNMFVNLRCLQLTNDQFILYSGAGITAASVAQNEWVETENKMLTMINVITPGD